MGVLILCCISPTEVPLSSGVAVNTLLLESSSWRNLKSGKLNVLNDLRKVVHKFHNNGNDIKLNNIYLVIWTV
jgi:hypothetical protein